MPLNNILNNFYFSDNKNKSIKKYKNSFFNISINFQNAINSGHSNIDNSAEFFVPGMSTNFFSTRFEYYNKWILIEFEPYGVSYNGISDISPLQGTYKYNNHHNNISLLNKREIGLRQSRVFFHYKNFGLGFGNENHWWSPGFHSAIALSSNAASQNTFSFGFLEDLKLGNFSFGGKIIVMPYKSNSGSQLYFSGLKSYISHHSRSAIVTVGFHRTFLSGDFSSLLSNTNKSISSWGFNDAALLVIEPIFGQSKKDLDYTIPGTPGFDIWDEVITGYIKLTFPNENLEVYADIASDDNRGNLIDFKAHWDHTLGYMVGVNKFTKLHQWKIFTGLEYLTTRVSNTFKPSFYRGEEPNNFYAKHIYDFFTYKGRRMGAHSGSSSDDLIFMIGLGNNFSRAFISFNKERLAIKNKEFPELKTEFSVSYHAKLSNYHSMSITFEYEVIRNYSFIENNLSDSKLFWLGYTFYFN